MVSAFKLRGLMMAHPRSCPITSQNIIGKIPKFSTKTVSHKDSNFNDIFKTLRKTTKLRAEEFAQIEAFAKKDLEDENRKAEDNEEELSRMFLKESENPNNGNDGDEVSNEFWENVFNSSYNMKKLEPPEKPKKLKQTFMNMGEAEPWEEEGMLPDDEDDLTSLGHGELEQHREMRHYARLAAWEMPLLYNLRKPFNPPTLDKPLRFRYTTYLGEQHPAEKKVVLEFCPLDIPDLSDIQREKLRKIAGVRWNPEKDIVKMSCESYETQAQNKRYLGDVFASLLKEARDTTDTMIDIPLNTRYHSFKKTLQFPQKWVMTETRQKELEQHRKSLITKDAKLEKGGLLIDGSQNIQISLKAMDKTLGVYPANEEVTVGEVAQVQTIAVKR